MPSPRALVLAALALPAIVVVTMLLRGSPQAQQPQPFANVQLAATPNAYEAIVRRQTPRPSSGIVTWAPAGNAPATRTTRVSAAHAVRLTRHPERRRSSGSRCAR